MSLTPYAPLILPAHCHPDFSPQDWDRELDQMIERNLIIDQVFAGERPLSDLLDLVESQGVDVEQYCDHATERIERFIAGDMLRFCDPNELSAFG